MIKLLNRTKDSLESYKKEPSQNEFIPFVSHVTEHIVSTKSGSYLTTFKIFGLTHECASEGDLYAWLRNINQAFKSNCSSHYTLYIHLYRHKTEAPLSGKYEHVFPKILEENYRKTFEEKPLMVNDWYLTLEYDPIADRTQKIFSFFEKVSHKDFVNIQDDAIKNLDTVSERFLVALQNYGISRLGFYYRDQNGNIVKQTKRQNDDNNEAEDDDFEDDDVIINLDTQKLESNKLRVFSQVLEFYNFLLNHTWRPVPVTRDYLDNVMGSTRIVSSAFGDILQLRLLDKVLYTVGLEIRDYDNATEPGHLNILMETDFEFIMTQSFSVFPQASSIAHLRLQQKALIETNDPSVSQIQQINEAMDGIASKNFIMGWHYGVIHVFDEDQKALFKKADYIINLMNSVGIVTDGVKLASIAAWYSILPGNASLRPRPALISSNNFFCFNSFHNFMTGKAKGNPWGDAITVFKNYSGAPLFFNFHSTPLEENNFGELPAGHSIILGRTGSGKSTLLSALLACCTKYSPRMFIFDKDQGLFPITKSLKGKYIHLRDGEPSGWQPLQLEPTTRNIKFVSRLVTQLCEISLSGELYHSEKEAISQAVNAVMGSESNIPIFKRRLTHVQNYIPGASFGNEQHSRSSLRSLIAKWCEGGENAWLFDNPRDEIDFSLNDIFTFDITEFVVSRGQKPPETRSPMLAYLFFRIRESIDGTKPSMLVFDEFAQYLDDPVMENEVKRGLKTDRKKNAIYVFSTQEPNDALESNIGKTISQAVVTKVLLENPDATKVDYVDGLKLTESEFERFLQIPEHSRQFLIKQGTRSAIASMNLRGLDRIISVLSGTPVNSEILQKVIDEVGDDPEKWLPIYFERLGL